MGQNQWDPILGPGAPGVGEFTTHFSTYFSWAVGMFTGGTIWILTHGHAAAVECCGAGLLVVENVIRGTEAEQMLSCTVSLPADKLLCQPFEVMHLCWLLRELAFSDCKEAEAG